MMKIILIILLHFLSTTTLATTTESFIKINSTRKCVIRTIIQTPEEGVKIKADMLFLIGFGDRADNHGPLFKLMNEQGLRVISFDYPTHGKTNCSHIDYEGFTSLSYLVEEIEEKTRQDINRPLFLSGWSTGGLLAIRMVQQNFLSERFIQGVILITPGVSVYTFVGGDGVIRQKTLSQNPTPPHAAPPRPLSPFFTPFFTNAVKLNGLYARKGLLPFHTPFLVLVAGDKLDKYVRTPILKKWIYSSRVAKNNLFAFQCENSMHEMDNEIAPIGHTVRNLIKDFVLNQTSKLVPINHSACKSL